MAAISWEEVEREIALQNKAVVKAREEELRELRQELASARLVPLTVVTEEIAGFTVPKEVPNPRISELEKEINQKSKKFAASLSLPPRAEKVRQNLKANGMSPEGVVPVGVFAGMCRKFGLFRFEGLTPEGKVRFDTNSVGNIGQLIFSWFFLALITISVPIAFYVLHFHYFSHNVSPIIASLIDVMLGIVTGFFMSLFVTTFFIGILGGLVQKIAFRRLSLREKCHVLWPAMRDMDIQAQVDGNGLEQNLVKVNFSDVSGNKKFVEDLRRAKSEGLSLCVAAVPEAIGISYQEINHVVSVAHQYDPILYLIVGDFAVILSQEGDFAAEQEVMNWVRQEARKHLAGMN